MSQSATAVSGTTVTLGPSSTFTNAAGPDADARPRPHLGQMVHVLVDKRHNNGSDVAAAFVTRVWSNQMVNLRVVLDGTNHSIEWATSRVLHPTEAEAREHHANGLLDGAEPPVSAHAFWAPRH